MRLVRRFLVVVLVVVLLASCSGGGGGTAFTTAGGSSVPGSTSSSSSSTSAATTSSTATTTTLLGPDVGVVEAVYPEAGSLIVSERFGIVPANLINVALEVGAPSAEADAVAAAVGGVVVGRLEAVDFYQISFDGATEADLSAALRVARAEPGVVLAVADAAVYLRQGGCESRSFFGESGSYSEGRNARPFEMIGVEEAWDVIRGSGVELHGTKVGVTDSALSSFSSELSDQGSISGATDADYVADPARDEDGELVGGGITHGTGTSQVIAATPDGEGVTGVAALPGAGVSVTVTNIFNGPGHVEVGEEDRELVSLYEENGKAFTLRAMAAMLAQIRGGATVINMSWGASGAPSAANEKAAGWYTVFFRRMHAKFPGVVFVAAAGNDGGGTNGKNDWPGGIPAPNLITVGGVDRQGRQWEGSEYEAEGGEITIAAPAVDIPIGVGWDGNTVKDTGNSFAAPMVSGAVALLKSINPDLTAEQIKQVLVETAAPGPEQLGGGLLRVDEAALRVINDLREDANPPQEPLDKETLLGLNRIHGELTPAGLLDFKVTASVDAVRPDGGTALTAEVTGEGTISGDSPVALQGRRSATWTLTVPQEGAIPTVRVCRTDVGACCNLTPQPATIDGHYLGTITIETVQAPPDEIERYGIDPSQFIGVTAYTMEIDLTTNANGSRMINAAITNNFNGLTFWTGEVPLIQQGDQVSWEISEEGHWEWHGTVSQVGDTVRITGTFSGPAYDTGSMTGTWEATQTE